MLKTWTELTPEEKRAERLKKWLSAEGLVFPTPEAKNAYQTRLQRIIDAISLKEPDRVPCSLPVGSFPAYHYGLSTYITMYSYELAKDCAIKFMHEFESDTFSGGISSGFVSDIVKTKSMKWPGHGLPKDAPMHQFVEGEYMKAEEYDLLIDDPSDYCMRYYLPRSSGAFEAFSKLMPFRNIMGMSTSFLGACMDPEVQASLQAILDATKEMGKMREAMKEIMQEALALGLPSLMSGGQAHAPFDIFADTMRGTRASPWTCTAVRINYWKLWKKLRPILSKTQSAIPVIPIVPLFSLLCTRATITLCPINNFKNSTGRSSDG